MALVKTINNVDSDRNFRDISINLGPTSAVPRPAGHLDPIGIDPAHLRGLALTQRELRGTTELR